MARRRFKLVLQALDDYVLYQWNYDPPVKSVGGSMGRVWPRGALDTFTYENLRAMGTGTHYVEFDEIQTRIGTGEPPPNETEDERLLRRVRFELFAEEVGGGTANWAFTAILEGMTSKNAARVAKLLPDHHVERLREFAQDIPATEDARAEAEYTLFSSSGYTRSLPDENLRAIRGWLESSGTE